MARTAIPFPDETMNATGPDPSDGLTTRLETLKHEVDAIQIQMMKSDRPWYQSASTILSLVALLFSFGTTAVSYYRTAQSDVHAARAELRDLIQQMAELPKENIAAYKTYADDPLTAGSVSGMINQENALLAKQAAAVMREIPEHVTSTEYLAVAFALSNASLQDQSLEFLEQAVLRADNANDEVGALRSHAALLFSMGDLELGRQRYLQALAVFAKYPGVHNPAYQTATHAITEMYWGQMEAQARNQEEAERHFAEADRHAGKIPPGPYAGQIGSQIAQSRRLTLVGSSQQVAAPHATAFSDSASIGTPVMPPARF